MTMLSYLLPLFYVAQRSKITTCIRQCFFILLQINLKLWNGELQKV